MSEGAALGEKIRRARLEKNLTQEQLAGSLFSKAYISEIERGNRVPRLLTLMTLARKLKLPVAHFLDDGALAEDACTEQMQYLGCLGLLADLCVYVPEDERRRIEEAMMNAETAGLIRWRRVLNAIEVVPA